MATQAEAQVIRSATQSITDLVTRDLTAFWLSLDLSNPERARDALLEYMPLLTAKYGDISATVSADWYDDLRVSSGAKGSFAAALADTVPDELVEERVRFGAAHLFTDAPSETLSFLLGVATEYALQPGRDTITGSSLRDPEASGWHRQSAGGCAFCQMLEGLGGVYKESTANFASHTNCKCIALPSWDADATEVSVEQYVASRRTSAMNPEQREKHRANIRGYLNAT